MWGSPCCWSTRWTRYASESGGSSPSLLRSLRDEAGYAAFAALHVPIYALLLAGLFGGGGAGSALIVGMDAFFVVHVALHVLFRNHPENRFGSAFSWSLIVGSGACGLVDLVLSTGI